MKTVIVIPTYNERNNIEALIPEVLQLMPHIHIMVVDDNSPDGTADVVRRIAASNKQVSLLWREKKEGLGKAYLHAFEELSQDVGIEHIVMMDADFSHHPSYLPAILKAAETSDMVIGSRYVGGGSGTEGWELWRRVLSRLASFYCRAVTRMPLTDFTAGYMLIRTTMLDSNFTKSIDLSGYAFLIELKYALWKKGARMSEVPIVFKRRREGESKLSSHIIREGIIAPWKMIFRKRV
ncbi:MAG TPA: polyprenol monophosphomannose synthase [Candidatus Paceibacterota bacterium]